MNRKKIRLLAISLLVITLIAGTIAFLSDRDEVTNRFTASKLEIRIVEPNWTPDQTIVPDQKINKDPYIENTEDTAAFVFMEVTVPTQNVTLEERDPDTEKGKLLDNTVGKPALLFKFIDTAGILNADPLSPEQTVNATWHLMDGYPRQTASGYTYLYAYTIANSSTMAKLDPGKRTTEPLFQKVLFCNAREDDSLPGSTLNIEIRAYGIQADYLKSANATETEAEQVWKILTETDTTP